MVSFILCIAMCMALAIPAFAVELSPYATDEVGNFSQMIEFAFSDNVEGRFRYSYNDAAGNVVDGTLSGMTIGSIVGRFVRKLNDTAHGGSISQALSLTGAASFRSFAFNPARTFSESSGSMPHHPARQTIVPIPFRLRAA